MFDPRVGQRAYNDYLDQLEYAGEVGFDGICVNEHHANAYGMMPSPNLMAATLARRTTKPKLVVMGNSVALYHPPIRVAEEMAMLDVMSGGRIVAGFPVGSPMDTAYCMGENPTTLREKYYENVDFILKAWTEKKVWAFNGKYSQHRYVNPWPRPMQDPHPPVWIPGGGSVETWDRATTISTPTSPISGAQAAHKGLAGYWEAVDRLGKEPNPYRAGFNTFVAVADDDAHAEQLYGEAALYFYDRCLHSGLRDAARLCERGNTAQRGHGTHRRGRRRPEADLEIAVDGGAIAAGSPDMVVQRLTELCRDHKMGT